MQNNNVMTRVGEGRNYYELLQLIIIIATADLKKKKKKKTAFSADPSHRSAKYYKIADLETKF